MRTETTTRNLYSFGELSDKSKNRVIEQLWDINVDCDWWDSVYEDAAYIGLKITSFDTGRSSKIDGELTMSGLDVCSAIRANHGPNCGTTRLADAYRKDWEALPEDAYGDKIGDEELTQKFLDNLLKDYLRMLREEYEYLCSSEPIIETIKANDYEFTEDGELA